MDRHASALSTSTSSVPRSTVSGSAIAAPLNAVSLQVLHRVDQCPRHSKVRARNGCHEIVQRGFGRIAIGHSELNGHQSVTGALAQGKGAAEQVLSLGE